MLGSLPKWSLALSAVIVCGAIYLAGSRLLDEGRARQATARAATLCQHALVGHPGCDFWESLPESERRDPWGNLMHCEIGDNGGQVVALGSDGRLGGLGLAADTKCRAAVDAKCYCRVGESVRNIAGQRSTVK